MFEFVLVNSLIDGLLLGLFSLSFAFIYAVLKNFHLAHAGIYSFGSILFYLVYDVSQSYLLASIAALSLVFFISILLEKSVYLPMFENHSNESVSLVVSFGLYLLFVNIGSLIGGDQVLIIPLENTSEFNIGGSLISSARILQALVSSILVVAFLLFTHSNAFLQFKAVIDNYRNACLIGVKANNVRLCALSIGTLLVLVCGVLKLMDTGLTPHDGFPLLLTSTVAVILGGINNFIGVFFASLLLAFFQTLFGWYVSDSVVESFTLLLLLVILIWKKEGLINNEVRVEAK